MPVKRRTSKVKFTVSEHQNFTAEITSGNILLHSDDCVQSGQIIAVN